MDTDAIRFSLYVCLYLLAGFAVTWWSHSYLVKRHPNPSHLQHGSGIAAFALIIVTVIWPVLVGAMVLAVINAAREVFGKK